ncbi:MAG: beta-L-arabinofuranosidase domain-containing protein [bacterium]
MSSRSLPALAGLVLLLSGALRAAAAFAPVAISVEEPDGIERRNWPLTVSVPLPRGALRDAHAAHVADDHGGALPTQTRELATWPDGSIRWLLVDTQVELRPRQKRTLQLREGPSPRAPSATLKVANDAERVTVDTGALEFSVPRHHFAALEGLHAVGKTAPSIGPIGSTLVAGERSGAAQAPQSVEVLERGPLRTRILMRGTYGNGFDYVIRVDAYAGQRFVRILHTFVNHLGSAMVSLPRVSLELPLGELKPGSYRYGVAGERQRNGDLGDDGLHLVQVDEANAEIDGEPDALQLAGWVELQSGRGVVGLAARWFWQEYPQSLIARHDGLTYNMRAPETEAAKAGVGVAKTHELALWIAPPGSMPANVGTALLRPLVGVVAPAWVASSGALSGAVAASGATAGFARKAHEAARRYLVRNGQERWNDCGEVHCADAASERPRVGAYGMWNWGDWNFRGYQDTTKGTDSWGNLEYDTAFVMALAFAESGDPELLDATVATARHAVDVDVIHAYPERPDWVGMNHPKNPLHFSFALGGPDLGHTWTQGMVAAYYLTGDERSLAAARGIADYLTKRITGPVHGNPRQWGWPQIALLSVYEATGEARYLEAAKRYAAGGMAAHPPTASAQWKLGILADALAYLHAATGDAAARAWLDAYVDAVMKRKAREDVRAFPAVAYLARISGDRAMRDAALQRAGRLDLGSWGKPFSINGRIGFRIYSLLEEPAAAERPGAAAGSSHTPRSR